MIVSNTPTRSIRGFYEPQDLPYGTAYVWHTAAEEELQAIEEQRLPDEVLHPWRYSPEHDGEDQLPY